MLRPSPDGWKEEHFVQGQEYVPTFTNRFRKSQLAPALGLSEEHSERREFAEIGDLMRGGQRSSPRQHDLGSLARDPAGLCDDRDCVSLHYRKRIQRDARSRRERDTVCWHPTHLSSATFVKPGTGRAELSPEDVAILRAYRH